MKELTWKYYVLITLKEKKKKKRLGIWLLVIRVDQRIIEMNWIKFLLTFLYDSLICIFISYFPCWRFSTCVLFIIHLFLVGKVGCGVWYVNIIHLFLLIYTKLLPIPHTTFCFLKRQIKEFLEYKIQNLSLLS